MKKQRKHINFRALALAMILFMAFGSKEMHHFLSHAHEEVKICDAKKGEVHLHDEEYLSHECTLCDFTFSIFDFQLTTFKSYQYGGLLTSQEFSIHAFIPSHTHLLQSLRGPPAI